MPEQYVIDPQKPGMDEFGEPEALKTLIDHLPFGAGLFTMDGRMLRHNPAFARIYGMDKPPPPGLFPEGVDPQKLTIWQLIEAGFFDHLFDDAHQAFIETFESLERGDDHFKTIEVFDRLLEIHDRPIGNGLIISTHTDVTERIHAQQEAEAARTSEEKARTDIEKILTSIRDAVYALDSAWRFTFLNHQAEQILERNAAELIGRSIWEEFPEAVGSEVYVQYHKARDENVGVDFKFYYSSLKRWFDIRAFPQDEGGLTVYFQDVTNWVAQEEQLRQAQKMEAVGQLTSGIAHDFNNLLTVILGNAETILDGLDKDNGDHRLISMIGHAAERAADLTRRLLAFSRQQALDPKTVDINALIGELEPLLKRTLGEQYDIEFISQDGVDKAVIDPGQLQNTIVNLAINARDAMPGGGRLVIETAQVQIDDDYIETHLYAESGRYVMIAVADNGVGMPPEARSRAFEPFFTTKEVGAGTGLGLSMVYGFIKQSQGHVNIYSEPGEGTTVKLYLPCVQEPGDAGNQSDAIEPIRHGSERILVVEDDMLVREHTASTLISLGYDVRVVADGPAAGALLGADDDFDLLLCDVILGGGMNGRQVAETAQEITPHLKVLYMSGYTKNIIAPRGWLDAGRHLLLKPFRRADLAMMVRKALDDGD